MTNPAAEEGRRLARILWLDTVHAPIGAPIHAATDLADDDWVEIADGSTTVPVDLACGKRGRVVLPGLFTRLNAQRCRECCAHTGLPEGTGAPKNDPACRALLGLDEGTDA